MDTLDGARVIWSCVNVTTTSRGCLESQPFEKNLQKHCPERCIRLARSDYIRSSKK